MHYVFSKDGIDHIVRGGADMQKALGLGSGGKLVMMTDETGELVGTGFGGENLMKSVPLLKAVRDGSLLKAMRAEEPLHRSRVNRPTLSKSFGKGGFNKLLGELEQLKYTTQRQLQRQNGLF